MEDVMGWLILIVVGLFALGWILNLLADGADKVADVMEEKENKRLDEEIDSARAKVREAEQNLAELAANSSYRNLNLDGLIVKSLEPFGDMITGIRDEMDPLVRLLVCYMFIEELSEKYSEDNSSIAEFSYSFLREELGDEDFENNFFGDVLGEGHFETPVFWGNVVQSRIEGSYAQADADGAENLKSSLCASFCSDLAEGIDEALIERFVDKAKESLDKSDMLTSGAKSTFLSLAL
jgi:hypothetical protein